MAQCVQQASLNVPSDPSQTRQEIMQEQGSNEIVIEQLNVGNVGPPPKKGCDAINQRLIGNCRTL